jgi:hypothetical protein
MAVRRLLLVQVWRHLQCAVAVASLCGACAAKSQDDSEDSGACQVVKTDAGQEQCLDNFLKVACDALPHKKAYSNATCNALGYTVECMSLGSSPVNGMESVIYGKVEADCE